MKVNFNEKQATFSVAHGAVIGGTTGDVSGVVGAAKRLQQRRRTYYGY